MVVAVLQGAGLHCDGLSEVSVHLIHFDNEGDT